jgi:membrane protein implicated in regulation of membrane protease activity
VLLLVALALVLVLPAPWGLVGAVACGAFALVEVGYWQRRMRGWKVQTGAEKLVGSTGHVTKACEPVGQVRVLGELWQARSSFPLPRGTPIRVVALRGLTVDVEAADVPG